ncbi:MAG: fibronectin type III domain-containing protein [Verrucomicrobiota bacterium]|nr:fibronectin type III domain-containing protein [Verrucomicrobiota bacterium]
MRTIALAFLCGFVSTASFLAAETGAPAAGQHLSRAADAEIGRTAAASSITADMLVSPDAIVSTRSSFTARWSPMSQAISYRLDVSTSPRFDGYVTGYHGLEVGPATWRVVTGLVPSKTYYYRVTGSNEAGVIADSGVMTGATAASSGLVISPTFDSSITNNPNVAAIEATINRAIAIYESLYSDPITVFILFRYSPTRPNGTPFGSLNVIAVSDYVVYSPSWNTFISALQADAKTANDATANASLPSSPLSTSIICTSANGRALAGDTPPAMFGDSTVGAGGPYDGIVTLNSSAPYQFVRPVNNRNIDAQRLIEHEIDEVLGLGSRLDTSNSNVRPQDLFSWSSPGARNISKTGTRYFSIDGGNTVIVNFNQSANLDSGDWQSDPCPQANPYVQNAFACSGQASDISETSPEGINLDVIGYDLIVPASRQLLNIATRVEVLGGEQVLIGGLIVSGSDPKKVIIRGIGPSLSLNGPLADPTLELHQGSVTLSTNDNWKVNDQTGQSQEAEVRATTVPPGNDLESAIVTTLTPGSYTAILAGKNGGTGVGVIEVFDLAQAANSKLANLSSRGFVDTGDNVMIGGLIVGGPSGDSARVLVRALGPSLTGAGVAGALPDPTLELHNGNGSLLATNDNWKTRPDGSSQQAEIEATTLPPANALESALVRSLPPGNYTAVVRGVNNSTGIGLVEVYNLQ